MRDNRTASQLPWYWRMVGFWKTSVPWPHWKWCSYVQTKFCGRKNSADIVRWHYNPCTVTSRCSDIARLPCGCPTSFLRYLAEKGNRKVLLRYACSDFLVFKICDLGMKWTMFSFISFILLCSTYHAVSAYLVLITDADTTVIGTCN